MATTISPAAVPPTFLRPVTKADLAAARARGPSIQKISAQASDPDLLRAGVQDAPRRERARDAAQKFEGQFLSTMMQQMFQGVSTEGPFSGGFGEEMFRSMMTDAMAKQMTKAGGIGLSDTIQREILKMQGLS